MNSSFITSRPGQYTKTESLLFNVDKTFRSRSSSFCYLAFDVVERRCLIYGVPKGSKSTEVVDHSVYAYFDIHVRLNIDVHVYI